MTSARHLDDKNADPSAIDGDAPLRFSILERNIEVRCGVTSIVKDLGRVVPGKRIAGGAFGGAGGAAPRPNATVATRADPDLRYEVVTANVAQASIGGLEIRRSTGGSLTVADAGECVAELPRDLVYQIQLLRPDLYFVHAAVLASSDQTFMIVAASGSGKSTTAWALTGRGYRYLSDELAPIELPEGRVRPYPQAISLKTAPPEPFRLPAATLRTSVAFHVPVEALSGGVADQAGTASTILFLERPNDAAEPESRPLSAAEAGARLFAGTLNAGAHLQHGVDAALAVAGRARCFALRAGDLAATCDLIESLI